MAWDSFVSKAKNSTFLFYRDFMEYHKDRFEDFSLMVFKKGTLVAVFPANKVDNSLFSHQGLTFGGVIVPFDITSQETFQILDSVLEYLKESKINALTVKLIPEFYFKQPANELKEYLLTHDAKLENKLMVLAIDYSKPWTIHKTKLKHFSNNKHAFQIEETRQFETFWNQVLIPRLKTKYNVNPVHTLDEINKLATQFSNQIKQFNIFLEGEILAGITIFENEIVVKSQYGATTKKGEKTRALDYLFLHLIFKYKNEGKHFFSMGTVTENNELGYNPGLLRQKEELGCVVYDQDIFNWTFNG